MVGSGMSSDAGAEKCGEEMVVVELEDVRSTSVYGEVPAAEWRRNGPCSHSCDDVVGLPKEYGLRGR